MLVRKTLVAALCVTATLGIASDSHAVFQVFFNAGTTNTTTALTGFGTTGDLMAGMNVRTTFTDATFEDATWASLGFPAGNAVGTNWLLGESGDTFTANWTLTNNTGKAIQRVLIDAGPGDTVFDTFTPGNLAGTPGSARGKDFNVTSNHSALNIYATYIDQVALGANAPIGDLYRFLEIDFNAIGFASGSSLTYVADTDNLLFAGDLQPIPEPGTLGLLGIGLLGFARRMKRRQA